MIQHEKRDDKREEDESEACCHGAGIADPA